MTSKVGDFDGTTTFKCMRLQNRFLHALNFTQEGTMYATTEPLFACFKLHPGGNYIVEKEGGPNS